MKRNRLSIGYLSALVGVLLLVALVALSRANSGQANEEQPILQYPQFAPTPTIGPAPAGGPQTAGAGLLADTFASPDTLSRWTIVDVAGLLPEDRSVWTVKDGQLVQNRTAAAGNPSFNETMAIAGDQNWRDYSVTAKVYDQNNSTFGLVARHQGQSFYRFRINADIYPDTPKLVLEKVVNGVATPLVTSDGPGYQQRQWHVVSMKVAGSSIQVTLDGQVVAQATDSALASGQAGLYTRALGGIRFDDISVTTP